MILVTGASGLVGEAVFRHLSKYWDTKGTSYLHKDKRLARLDLTNEIKTRHFFKKNKNIETIVHCAAIIPSKYKGIVASGIYEANIKMLLNILKNINNNIYFINISSTGIYKLEGRARLQEDADIECNTFYKLSKKHSEDILNIFYTGTNNLLNIRISSPYSVNRDSDSILYKFLKCAVNENCIQLWGKGNRKQAFTNVDALASVIKKLCNKKTYGDFNYITTQSISMLSLASKIKNYAKNLKIENIDKVDPEENCQTDIDISKISRLISVKDLLDNDICKIISRLSK